jgi:hypothetical protein
LLDTEIERAEQPCRFANLLALAAKRIKEFFNRRTALRICRVQQERDPDRLATAVLSPFGGRYPGRSQDDAMGYRGCDDRLPSALTAKSLDPRPQKRLREAVLFSSHAARGFPRTVGAGPV